MIFEFLVIFVLTAVVMCLLKLVVWSLESLDQIVANHKAAKNKTLTDEVNAESHLLDLSKEQYDWLRDNMLEVTQATHDHFYPPHRTIQPDRVLIRRQPLDRWGDSAIDFDHRPHVSYNDEADTWTVWLH